MPGKYMDSPTLIWVCTDCMLDHHGVREDNPLESEPDRPTWEVYKDQDVQITAGMLFEHHLEGCENFTPEGEWLGVADEMCDRIDFTWSACDGCGSRLGGSREAFTVWYPSLEAVS